MTPTGQCTTQISPSYVENAQFLDNAQKASPVQVEALDAIEEVGMELGVEFVMKPGMLYFLNNHHLELDTALKPQLQLAERLSPSTSASTNQRFSPAHPTLHYLHVSLLC